MLAWCAAEPPASCSVAGLVEYRCLKCHGAGRISRQGTSGGVVSWNCPTCTYANSTLPWNKLCVMCGNRDVGHEEAKGSGGAVDGAADVAVEMDMDLDPEDSVQPPPAKRRAPSGGPSIAAAAARADVAHHGGVAMRPSDAVGTRHVVGAGAGAGAGVDGTGDSASTPTAATAGPTSVGDPSVFGPQRQGEVADTWLARDVLANGLLSESAAPDAATTRFLQELVRGRRKTSARDSIGAWAEHLQAVARRHSRPIYQSTAWSNAAANRAERSVVAALLWHKGLIPIAVLNYGVFRELCGVALHEPDADVPPPPSTSSPVQLAVDISVPRELMKVWIAARKVRRWLLTTKLTLGGAKSVYTRLSKAVDRRARFLRRVVPASPPLPLEMDAVSGMGSLPSPLRQTVSSSSLASAASTAGPHDVSRQVLAFCTSHLVDPAVVEARMLQAQQLATRQVHALAMMARMLDVVMGNEAALTVLLTRLLATLRVLQRSPSPLLAHNNAPERGGATAVPGEPQHCFGHAFGDFVALPQPLRMRLAVAREAVFMRVCHVLNRVPNALSDVLRPLLALLPVFPPPPPPRLAQVIATTDSAAAAGDKQPALPDVGDAHRRRVRLVERLLWLMESLHVPVSDVDTMDDTAAPNVEGAKLVDITQSVTISASCNHSTKHNVLARNAAWWETAPWTPNGSCCWPRPSTLCCCFA